MALSSIHANRFPSGAQVMAGMCRGIAIVWMVTGFFSAAKPHMHNSSVQQSLFIELPLYPYWIPLGWVCHAGSVLWLNKWSL
jgi:hypothetical protein